MLEGNNPRFPWKPSTTMLTRRHTGTTEDSASDRSTHHLILTPHEHPPPAPRSAAPPHRIFPFHGGPEGPWVADAKILLCQGLFGYPFGSSVTV